MQHSSVSSERVRSYYEFFDREAAGNLLGPMDTAYAIELLLRLSATVDQLTERVEKLEREVRQGAFPVAKSDTELLKRVMGIGKKYAEALLSAFGSTERIRQASVDELVSAAGIPRKVAERLKSQL